MIGLGRWACSVNTMFYSGDVDFEIFDNNGKYGFKLNVPDVNVPDVTVKSVEEDDDTITATIETGVFPGKDITLVVTLDDDTFDGYVKVPMFGKIKLKNGRKIS
ncbi:MAG: hypothetical protein IKB88_08925 [Clostridia bacterium]|nr:hypothetical protein [Clostridia bacterium]